MKEVKSIDEYIRTFPKDSQEVLQGIRSTISKLLPKAEETISYGIPTFDMYNTHVIHFAAHEKHIGFYPSPSGISAFKKELVGYKTSKGAVQFPLHKPMPMSLIKAMVKFRKEEVLKKNDK